MISRRSSLYVGFGGCVPLSSVEAKFDRLKKLQDSIYAGACLDLFKLRRDLESVADYLLLPDELVEATVHCFDDVLSKVKNPYNNYGLLLAVCLIASSRASGNRMPVKLAEVVDAFRMRGYRFSLRVLAKTLSSASNILPIKKFTRCEDYVGRVIERLKVSPYISVRIRVAGISEEEFFEQLYEHSKELLSRLPPSKRSGKNPFLLAASAVFETSAQITSNRGTGNIITKSEFSKYVGIAEYTLRSHLTGLYRATPVKAVITGR